MQIADIYGSSEPIFKVSLWLTNGRQKVAYIYQITLNMQIFIYHQTRKSGNAL